MIVDHEIRAGRGRGRFPRGRDQPDRGRIAGALGPAVHPGRSLRGREDGARVGSLSAALLPRMSTAGRCGCRRPLGPDGGLHAGAGLVPRGREPRRRQSASAQPDRAVQRADRLRLGRRPRAARHRLGTLPGAIPGRDRLPAFRLPHRRAEARAVEVDPRQALPDAGRPPRAAGSLSPRLPRAGGARPPPGPAGRAEADRVRLGRARHGASCAGTSPSWSGRRSTAASSTPTRGPPRAPRRASPGGAGAVARSGRGLARPGPTSRRSRRPRRGSATTSSGST